MLDYLILYNDIHILLIIVTPGSCKRKFPGLLILIAYSAAFQAARVTSFDLIGLLVSSLHLCSYLSSEVLFLLFDSLAYLESDYLSQ